MIWFSFSDLKFRKLTLGNLGKFSEILLVILVILNSENLRNLGKLRFLNLNYLSTKIASSIQGGFIFFSLKIS